ncbi:glycosyltransferase family protein [Gaetbulibacter aestuarii]|uniref:Glycosyltransferase n=1 Tax=Gaetbulibacter aestuarii TaxID=1502358 RepID=A0ABW7MZF5_9FLAO
MNNVIIYCSSKDELNVATLMYVEILNEALNFGQKLQVVNSISKVKNNNIVLTIRWIDFLRVKLNKPSAKCLNWFQGVVPEESFMKNGSKLKYLVLSFCEFIVIKMSIYNFFVSQEMYLHYKKKYNYRKNNFYIMPCFNMKLNENIHLKDNKKSLVYAGSMTKWQKVESVLKVYMELKSIDPDFELTILTRQLERSKVLLKKNKLLDEVLCKQVKMEDMPNELIKYKYGFLLRDNITVNKVACPTKMNSYLACGVIPIYSENIGDFKEVFGNMKYTIRVDDSSDCIEIAKEILQFDKRNLFYEDLYLEYKNLFEKFYNKTKYVFEIREKIKFLII